MKNTNIKSVYLKNLIESINIVNKQNHLDAVKEITFFTNFGFIVGELYEVVGIKAKTYDELLEEIKPMIKEQQLNAINIADWLTKQYIYENKITNNNDILILKNVMIYNYMNKIPVESNFFILFLDQITGIVPANTTVEK